MAPVHAPPTKILSSTPLSPAQAHAFLTAFTTAAEASKNDAHNGHNEIVLTNLKRIEQALIGIHVPRPIQSDMDIEGLTDMAAPLVYHVEGEWEEEEEEGGDDNGEDNGEDNIDASDERDEDRDRSIPAVQTVTRKVDKKADKKARRKEEKKHRAEQRMKEKESGDMVDDDSE